MTEQQEQPEEQVESPQEEEYQQEADSPQQEEEYQEQQPEEVNVPEPEAQDIETEKEQEVLLRQSFSSFLSKRHPKEIFFNGRNPSLPENGNMRHT